MVDAVLALSDDAIKVAPMRLRLRVQGVVQGVGFRPFVHHLAQRHALNGFVCNDSAGVSIEVEGEGANLEAFRLELVSASPPMAHVDHVSATPMPIVGTHGFTILPSQHNVADHTLISPDTAMCDDCLHELFDPTNRRYRYPFINCTNCGPRYTIIRELPYDRPLTTMAEFTQCAECQREYDDPENRRFHAQPNACPVCGPQLAFQWSHDESPLVSARHISIDQPALPHEAALHHAQGVLIHDGILTIKGIGGFHLACDATNDHAVKSLRQRKQRGDKPFAIMARDLASVLQVARVTAEELTLLTSPARPIVLLKKRVASPLSEAVAPGNAYIGVMLPYSPLHHLLFAPPASTTTLAPPPWLVMTSGNLRDEPIVITNEDAEAQLSDLADAHLLHNREIYLPCDDSVLRVIDGAPMPLRRSRGFAPLPIKLPLIVPPTLAVGGEIKNAFCLAANQQAFMSQHIGDMATLETQQAFGRAVEHMQMRFRIQPEIVACDLHPGYHTTRLAQQIASQSQPHARLVRVQHHHAHIASLMAEHGLQGDQPVIGFCFDGTGYGLDGAIWGGEVLVTDYRAFERVAHLAYFPLPGGDTAIHKPYRAALAALWAADVAWEPSLPPVRAASSVELAVLRRQLETNLACIPTSSMGRLFDIVAALCGICQVATCEAQAAIELETIIADDQSSYAFDLHTNGSDTATFAASPVLRAIVNDMLRGTPPNVVASRFHNALVNLVLEISITTRERTGINQVALSGGVFQNVALTHRTLHHLRAANFETLIHRTIPPNDGGLALGQVLVAAHQEA